MRDRLRSVLLSLSLLLSLAGFSAPAFAANIYLTHSQAGAACSAAYGGSCTAFYNANCTSGPGYDANTMGTSCYYKGWGDFFFVAKNNTCPAGTLANATGKCVPACTIPGKTNLLASDPLCVAASACTAGESASFVWSPGMRTGPGEDDHNATYDIPASQCNGTCTINKPASLDTLSCLTSGTNYPVPIICTLTGTKSGDTCTASDQASPATGTTTPEQPKSSLSCTDGTIKQADGSCAQPATPGTASTSTETGTAATPGAVGCPVGMSSKLIDGKYHCVGTAPPSGIGCPSDYTRVGEDCVSNHVIVPGGSDPTKAGNCGAPGQPSCEVSIAGDNPEAPSIVEQARLGSRLDGLYGDAVSGYQGSKTNWFSWVWTPPVGTCSAVNASVHGVTVGYDYCPMVNTLRDVIGWLFALFGAWQIYGQLFKRPE